MNNRFENLQEIYSSSNSKLFLATDKKTNEQVVLKTGSNTIAPAANTAWLTREYSLMQLVDSPYISKAIDLVTIKDCSYLVLTYYPGEDLYKIIRQAPLNIEQFYLFAQQLTKALQALHNAGIIHKNINPANIIVNTQNNQLVLIDLGISSEFSFEKFDSITPTHLEGSIRYIAPEQTGRINTVMDYRADFYALGVTFYEMLCGKCPFEMQSPMEIIFSHIAKVPDNICKHTPTTPRMLGLIIDKLLSKMAKDRYASAEGLLYDLQLCQTKEFFTLGQRDFSRHFEFSSKLYGREQEIIQLRQDLKEVTAGAKVLVTVNGYSGVGKSSLVNSIQEDIICANGLFLTGKFDQYHTNAPYFAFFQALEQMCNLLLAESSESMLEWKESLVEAIGDNISLLTSKIPGLSLLVGEQPPLGTLSPLEERTRFKAALGAFIRLLATDKHPLTLFLDDMHLADMGSMEMLEDIQKNTNIHHLMIVLCYRDNEVDENHPLVHSLNKIIRNGAKVTQIHLTGLNINHTAQMMGDNFRLSPKLALDLSQMLYKKTNGNPFYIKQFLRLCYMKGYLQLDVASGIWQWDANAMANCSAQENVLSFILANLEQIPKDTTFVISCCACIGQVFSRAELLSVCKLKKSIIDGALKQAVEFEIIFPITKSSGDNLSHFQFAHDRFQQAFYTALPEKDRALLHIKLGNLYVTQMPNTKDYEERIFEIADHYSKSLKYSQSPKEHQKMLEILLKASYSCTRISAFDTALHYLNLLLEEKKLEHDFLIEVQIAYHTVLCNLAYIKECDQAYDTLCRLVENPLQMVDSCCLHITSLSTRGEYDKAVSLGIDMLDKLGISFYTTDIEKTLQDELKLFYSELEQLGENHILTKNEATDQLQFAISKLLYRVVAPSLFHNPLYTFWIVLSAARLIFRHGYTPYGLRIYSNLMVPLMSLTGDYKTAYVAGKSAMQLAEKEQYRETLYSIYHLFSLHTCHWFESLPSLIPYARESIKGHAQMGDFEYACYGYFTAMTAVMETANHIDDLLNEVEPAIAFAIKTGNNHSLGTFYSFHQFCKSLKGELELTGSFNSEDFSEDSHEQLFFLNKMALCYFYILRALSAVIYKDYQTAFIICQRCAPILPFITGFYPMALHSFLYSLSICKVLELELYEDKREELLQVLENNQQWLFGRQQDSPKNFAHLYLIVQAERTAAQGDFPKSLELYEQALIRAKAHEGLMHHALVCELVASRYEAINITTACEQYLYQAYQLYQNLGANGKMQLMQTENPWLLNCKLYNNAIEHKAYDTTVYTTTDIDINSVMKASIAIAQELQIEGILEKLIYVLLENAGAQDIYYLSTEQNSYIIQAEGHTATTNNCILSEREATDDDISLTILRYVENSLETVILDNAIASSVYGRDNHIQKKSCKSILCMPVLSKGTLKGLLYLENNLAIGVFDQRRKEILIPIAAQLAISLENAYLYEHLRYLVDERTKELQEEIKVRKKAEEGLERMAHFDPLTGLPNRRHFNEILSKAIFESTLHNQTIAVLFLDLDGFKVVNDTYGHEKGDIVLVEITSRLISAVRGEDVVSRMGGDEFVLILRDMQDRKKISYICDRIREEVGKPISISDTNSVIVTPSIGISIFPQDSTEPEELITLADKAMYHAKRNLKNQYVFSTDIADTIDDKH